MASSTGWENNKQIKRWSTQNGTSPPDLRTHIVAILDMISDPQEKIKLPHICDIGTQGDTEIDLKNIFDVVRCLLIACFGLRSTVSQYIPSRSAQLSSKAIV